MLSVRQCTVIVQQFNICTVILHCVQRRPHKNSINKQKLQIFPFIFYPNSNSFSILSKRTFSSHISYALTVYCLLFCCLWLLFLLSLSQSHNKSHHTHPINHTAYSCSQMQDFSAFWSHLALYTFYWHPQILLDNKLKWFTYSFIRCIYSYVSYGYQNIQLYTYRYVCMYVCIYVCMYLTVTIKLYCIPVTQFYWYSTVTCDYCGAVFFFIP